MNKKTIMILALITVAFGVLVGISIRQRDAGSRDTSNYLQLDTIKSMSQANDYAQFDLNTIIAPNTQNGNLPENIKGDANAEVVIYEYADYLCSHCAQMNVWLNRLVNDYNGRVAVVFRSYNLEYNGIASVVASAAANAAAKQGYWAQYKDLLFSNQAEWGYLVGDKLQGCLERYFEEASIGVGDLEQFRVDMRSEAVAKKGSL